MPPQTHWIAGFNMAAQVRPLDSAGQPSAEGKYVLVSIGMSNTTQEFSTFIPLANADTGRNPRLVIVDGAQGGQTAAIISIPSANFWTVVDQRLTNAGVAPQQVQVAWLKEANARPTAPFPPHADTLKMQFGSICRILKDRYPNIKICYLSSRTYGGYASTNLNPEPYAYESGFAVKWLIEEQIEGDSALNFDSASGPMESPYLAWGPYLWADGLVPRSDGLIWECSDFSTNDGTHPSASGRMKVANMLLNFFQNDPAAQVWYRRNPVGRGDLNGDGGLAPSDVVLLLNYVFTGQLPPTGGLFAADLDCSGGLNPADVVLLMNAVFSGAPAPPRCG
ncbi:MAG: hypothetical protein L0Z48_05045 [candidate division Zixibacteria bacterium]|nr:hypothetical protein [candidate division Zixibacteria bacterium]